MLGKKYLSAAIASGSITSFLKAGNIEHLFVASESAIFEFVQEHVRKYGTFPTEDTIFAHTQQTLLEAQEPAAYYLDQMGTRYIENELKRCVDNIKGALKQDDGDKKALDVLKKTAMSLSTSTSTMQVVDFRQARHRLMQEYKAANQAPDLRGLMLGWPTLDVMTGGLKIGDMISYVGRPGAGKSAQMVYGMMYGWLKNAMLAAEGKKIEYPQSRLLVSMEMSVMQVEQRMAAMVARIPHYKLSKGALSTISQTKFKKGLTLIEGFPEPFWIVDGNLAATVEDIWMLAQQLKPDAIGIDGGYLVKHPTERDRYRRVAENAELMKSELASMAPTVVSWQFAKTGAKSKKAKGENPNLEDIGYTDAIAQVSSLVVALLSQGDNESTLLKKVEILKGRGGETGSFLTNWNWEVMDFSEYQPVALESMQID